jgi:hypothetical protein
VIIGWSIPGPARSRKDSPYSVEQSKTGRPERPPSSTSFMGFVCWIIAGLLLVSDTRTARCFCDGRNRANAGRATTSTVKNRSPFRASTPNTHSRIRRREEQWSERDRRGKPRFTQVHRNAALTPAAEVVELLLVRAAQPLARRIPLCIPAQVSRPKWSESEDVDGGGVGWPGGGNAHYPLHR